MLRAGPLSFAPVLDLLSKEFVNCWILAEDLEAIAKDESQPENVRAAAKVAFERYKYPVDSQMMTADGKLLSQAATNDIMSPDMDALYLAALKKALAARSNKKFESRGRRALSSPCRSPRLRSRSSSP